MQGSYRGGIALLNNWRHDVGKKNDDTEYALEFIQDRIAVLEKTGDEAVKRGDRAKAKAKIAVLKELLRDMG